MAGLTPQDTAPLLVSVPPHAESPPRRWVRHLFDKSARAGILSRPLLDRLPLRRWVPSAVHSLLDYRGGAVALVSGQLSTDRVARRVGRVLGLSSLAVALFTDTRLSLSRRLSIETHELSDYAHGAALLLAPFALGYARRSPGVAAVHALLGLSTLGVALVTDYRGQRGLHLGGVRRTDPEGIGA
ncbi:hypothetical protein NVS55_03565 [Myxococcus stipitatus]|uniref:hypothetical protein n=1 Tax=Myxococcus stipitatus TaxID=83455 RepID=UPI0031455A2A